MLNRSYFDQHQKLKLVQMGSLEKLGFSRQLPVETVVTTYSPGGEPHASTIGIKAHGKSKVSLKIYTDTITYRNLSISRAAVINVVRDVELLVNLALRDLLNFDDRTLKFKSSKSVNAPRLENADAFLEVEVESLRKRRVLDEIGESEAAYFTARIRCMELKHLDARALLRSDSPAIESAVLSSKIIAAMKNGKESKARKLFSEITKYEQKRALGSSGQEDSRLIVGMIESLRRRFGWRE